MNQPFTKLYLFQLTRNSSRYYVWSAHYSRRACGQELSAGVDPVPPRYKEMHSSQASRHAYSRAGLNLYCHTQLTLPSLPSSRLLRSRHYSTCSPAVIAVPRLPALLPLPLAIRYTISVDYVVVESGLWF